MTPDDNLEERLARDAARMRAGDAPPPFDLVFDQVSTARRPRHAWLAVAAVVFGVAAAVAVAVVLRRPDAPSRPGSLPVVPLPAPHSIRVGGHEYVVQEVAPDLVVPSRTDPRSVSIVTFATSGSSEPLCNTLRPSARVVSESGDVVSIATFAYRAPVPNGGRRHIGCTLGGRLYAHLSLRLRQPLGARSLRDARTGEVIPTLDQLRLPTPSYLPDGFVQTQVHAASVSSDDVYALRQYQGGLVDLEIQVRPDGSLASLDDASKHVDVNGRPAAVTNEGGRCLAWASRPGVRTQVCSYGTTSVLSVAELTKVARSLH